jgi:3-hydroxyacyl-[acyl-carrier-protein] dehydratase
MTGSEPFRLLEGDGSERGRRFRVEIPAASPLFAGHFPGRPLLPGIAHLAIVERALASPLAAVRALRLRRPVAPGETLDLLLGSPDGDGWIRFEITRQGEGVSTGAVQPSPARGENRSEPAEAAVPAAAGLPVGLPHAPPARMIWSVATASAEGIVCMAEVSPAHPLVAGHFFPAYLGIEAAAQAAAVLEALTRRPNGPEEATPRIGYLVGIREARFALPLLAAGRPFRVSARLQGSAPPLSIYEIEAGEPDRPGVTGTVSTFLADS